MVKKHIKKAHQTTKQKASKFKKEAQKQVVLAILAAFAFLIALSWRDFISDSVNKIVSILGFSEQLYFFKLLSALTVTLIAVLGILLVSKFKVEENVK